MHDALRPGSHEIHAGPVLKTPCPCTTGPPLRVQRSLATFCRVTRSYCLLALLGLGCSTDTLAPRIFDAAWCDVVALPCVKISEPGNGLPASCAVPGLSAVPV